MSKVGASQGTALAGLASIFRKGSTKKLTRSASSTSKDRDTPPQVKVKPSKKTSDSSSPDLSRLKADSPSMRSSFKLFKKKKGRLSRGNSNDDVSRGSFEDLRSETSSLSSISRISIREEDAFEGNFPQKEVHSPFKEVSSPLRESSSAVFPGKSVNKADETAPSNPPLATTSTPLPIPPPKPTPAEKNALTVASPTRKDRSDSLFKDMSDLFGDKDDLFDSAELSTLLAKTKTKFGKKEEEKEKLLKESDKPKKPLPALPALKPKEVEPVNKQEPIQQGPSKPMRKNRSRVLDTSLYDRAAENAIKSTKERKLEKEREKEMEKKKEEEKKKPQIALFEDLDDEEDDLFSEKKESKKKESKKKEEDDSSTKKVITKDDLFDELDEPVKPVSIEKETPKPKLVSEELFPPTNSSAQDKQDEQDKPVFASEGPKTPLFDDLEEEEQKKEKEKEDVVKSLFGDDSEKFTSKLTGPSSKPTSDKKKEEGEKEEGREGKPTEGEAQQPATIAEKTKIEIESEERKMKPETTSKASLFEDPPAGMKTEIATPKPKPIIVTKKPIITSPTHQKPPVTPTKPKPAVSTKPKRVLQNDEDTKKLTGKKDEEPTETVTTSSSKAEKEKEDSLEKDKKMEKDEGMIKKTEEEKERKQIEEEQPKQNKSDKEGQKIDDKEAEGKTILNEKEKKKEDEAKNKEQKETKKIIATAPAEKKDSKKGADDKQVPEWKRKLEEKRLQREKEERESAAKLEERRKKREELKSTDGKVVVAKEKDTQPSSPKPTGKPPAAKPKPKPSPITSGITITLSSTSTKSEKSPISPKREPTTTPPAKDQSPPIDPSLPKWKQDLIMRKKSSGSGPGSPRRSTVSVEVGRKEEDLPAWKKELLAKKKAGGGEVRNLL